MTTVTGVFDSSARAQRAEAALRTVGLTRINALLPGSAEGRERDVPVSEGEQPGMGAALGGLVGGAVGAAGGLGIGSAAATTLIPGVGPVVAFGIAAAALFGVGGGILERARGYLAARVAPASVTYGARGAYIVFDIERGPMFHLRSVTVTGPGQRDAAVVRLAAGDEAIRDRLALARQALADSFAHRGGKQVELLVSTDPAAAAVDVELATR